MEGLSLVTAKLPGPVVPTQPYHTLTTAARLGLGAQALGRGRRRWAPAQSPEHPGMPWSEGRALGAGPRGRPLTQGSGMHGPPGTATSSGKTAGLPLLICPPDPYDQAESPWPGRGALGSG